MNKVDELVEWVAIRVRKPQSCEHGCNHWWIDCGGHEFPCFAQYDTAKQILSHPDLTLIKRATLYKIKSMLKGIETQQRADKTIIWETEVMSLLKGWNDEIIPLAEALKEVKNK